MKRNNILLLGIIVLRVQKLDGWIVGWMDGSRIVIVGVLIENYLVMNDLRMDECTNSIGWCDA